MGCDQSPSVEAITNVLAAARERRVPVYSTTIAYLPDGRDGGAFVRRIPALLELQVGDRAATEIDPRIAPVEGEIGFMKKYPSAFFQANLSSLLVPEPVDTLMLTGCSTSACIHATAVDATSYGCRVIVPEEAVSDREAPHRANLFDSDAKYGDVIAVSEVVDYLRALPAPLGPSRQVGAALG